MSATYPGLHPFFDLSSFPYRQQLILRWLSSHFYLTNHSEEISLGPKSIYKYFLMKAPERIAEAFHLHREIIVVFSPYDNFELRTLDAFSTAESRLSQFRAGKVC